MTKKNSRKRSNKEYVSLIVRNVSTMSGTVHLTEKTGRHLTLWSVLMAATVCLIVCFILFVRQKYSGDHIVTEVDANCQVNQVPFPCVTICNFNMISVRESSNVRRLLAKYKINEKEILDFLSNLPRLIFYGVNSSSVPPFEHITNILRSHYYDMDILMEEVHQKCENLLLYCSFNRKQQKCNDIFNIMKTYEGHCCGFNYVGIEEESKQSLLAVDENIEYYDPNGDSSQISKMLATSESGRTSGLHVLFNVEPEDYPAWMSKQYFGGKVILSDPNDYPETTVLYQFFGPGESLDLKVVPLVYQANENLKRVDPAVRNCWYPTEVELEHTNRYSFETCLTECRMHTYLQYCGCIPYKYPKEKDMRICDLADLACLQNVTIHVSNTAQTCDPVCNIECNDKRYSMTTSTAPFLPIGTLDLPPGTNLSHVTSLRVYYQKSTCNCYKMKLLIDLNFIIATFGGVFSLGFGGSILTIIELFILLLSTLYIVCYDFLSGYVNNLKRNLRLTKIKPYIK